MNIKPSSFCSELDIRSICHQPFIFEGKLIATNGWSMLISPFQEGFPSADDVGISGASKELISKIINLSSSRHDYTYLESPLPEKVTCKTCDGSGEPVVKKCPECHGYGVVFFENHHHDYECDCQTCDASGKTTTANIHGKCKQCGGAGEVYPDDTSITIFGMKFRPQAIELIATESTQISPDADNNSIFFKVGEQSGAVMATLK